MIFGLDEVVQSKAQKSSSNDDEDNLAHLSHCPCFYFQNALVWAIKPIPVPHKCRDVRFTPETVVVF